MSMRFHTLRVLTLVGRMFALIAAAASDAGHCSPG
jgi:hypothetical protein